MTVICSLSWLHGPERFGSAPVITRQLPDAGRTDHKNVIHVMPTSTGNDSTYARTVRGSPAHECSANLAEYIAGELYLSGTIVVWMILLYPYFCLFLFFLFAHSSRQHLSFARVVSFSLQQIRVGQLH